jgi:hypothetical protein
VMLGELRCDMVIKDSELCTVFPWVPVEKHKFFEDKSLIMYLVLILTLLMT